MESVEELGERWQMIYQTLAAGTRRRIIGSLLEAPAGRRLSLPEAANLPEYRLDPERLRTNLLHNHLPMMAEAEFIEWESDPLTVGRGSRFDEVSSVILAIDEYDAFPQHLVEDCYFHEQNTVNL